jgi:deazaflavin-dependent oxidoreductase (nitroreductase family)
MPEPWGWVPSTAFALGARAAIAFHVASYRLTAGVVGHQLGPLTCLLLTTRGARTGLARTLPLVYGRDGEDLILVASKGGSPQHPAWYVNLKTNPEAVVQVGSRSLRVHARTATAAERPRLWQLMTRQYKGYDDYQRKAAREIPIVVLGMLTSDRL